MKKADIITNINALITEHDLDYDPVEKKTKMSVKDLNDLLADVEADAQAVQGPATFKLAELCKKLGKDPKGTRARFRRMYADEDAEDLPKPVAGAKQRWTFAEEDRETVQALVINE